MSNEQDSSSAAVIHAADTTTSDATIAPPAVEQPKDDVASAEPPASDPIPLPSQDPTSDIPPASADPEPAAVTAADDDDDDDAAPAPAATVDGVEDGAADASQDSKKNQNSKRRTSTVPEHKSKKLNKRKSIVQMQLDAEPGSYYWAKLRGHPSWPSVITDEEMLPENMLRSRPVTAKDASGQYRDDYKDDGKNVKGRTYPIMYLGSNEFSWILNTDLTPLNLEDLDKGPAKKSKALQLAYDTAKDQHDLAYYKQMLHDHQKAIQEEYARQQALEEEKAAKKEAKKTKRKSKGATDEDGDVVMDGVDGAEGAETKASKKRKKEAGGEDDAGKSKTPKKIKVNMPAVNGESSSKAKPKSKGKARTEKDASPVEPKMSAEEKREKREKAILFFRHKLQKGFISRDSPPKDEEMKTMSEYFANLESYKDLETVIIRNTKIHKVLKAIVKLTDIPRDEEFNFRKRAISLLEPWQKALSEESGTAAKADSAEAGESSTANKEEKSDGEKAGSEEAPAEARAEVVEPPEPKLPSPKAEDTKDTPDVTTLTIDQDKTVADPPDVPVTDKKPGIPAPVPETTATTDTAPIEAPAISTDAKPEEVATS